MWNLIKKELTQYFYQPFAYILIVIFLVLNGFFFFRSAYISNLASMTPMFDFLPWILMLLVPALAMRQISEEKLTGTFDTLLVQPIPLYKHLIVKVLAPVLFVSIALLLTIIIPLSLFQYGALDGGQVVTQYIAALLLVASISSLSVLASSTTKNQVIAFVIGVVLTFCFILVGSPVITIEVSGFVRTLLEQLSITGHYTNMTKGVIDVRDLLYFVSFLVSTFGIVYLLTIRDIVNTRTRSFQKLRISILCVIIISISFNIFAAKLPGRIDLTSNQLYTLSDATENILRSIDGNVLITLYSSEDLPPQVSTSARYVSDLLSDMKRKSGGTVQLATQQVTKDEKSIQEAVMKGIQPIRFNVISDQEVSTSQGFFGLVLTFGDKTEHIPFVQDTNNLEYQLLSLISKMTSKNKPTVYFLQGHGEKSLDKNLTKASALLGERFVIKPLTLTTPSTIPSDASGIVIAGPTAEIPESELASIHDYISNGGSLMLLVDGVIVDVPSLSAKANPAATPKLLDKYGLKIEPNLVFDLRNSDNVNLRDGNITYVLPYPYWPKLLANKDAQGFEKSDGVVTPWASTIVRTDSAPSNIELTPLLATTNYSSITSKDWNLNPQEKLQAQRSDLSSHVIAYRVVTKSNNEKSGKIVVIGDADIIDDERIVGGVSGANAVFIENSMDWLAGDSQLASIRSKSTNLNSLVFSSSTTKSLVRIANIVVVPAIVTIAGVLILYRRKRITRRNYNDEY